MTDQRPTEGMSPDVEWMTLMRRAERGQLYPQHFARLDKIRPNVSPQLLALSPADPIPPPVPSSACAGERTDPDPDDSDKQEERMLTSTQQYLDPRDLITPDEFAGVTAIVEDSNPGMDREVAEAIVSEALKFLAACGLPHTESLRPSRTVDEGWHALILTTQLYAPLCEKLAGHFIHHVPERGDVTRHDPEALTRTTAAIKTAGYEVNFRLWRRPDDNSIPVAADCEHTKCGDATCTPPCDPSKN